jgi:Uri superfamily endonuclease
MPGTYALLFRLQQPLTLTVGRLGTVVLPAADLVYVGSALGPGGLEARLARHGRRDKRPYWHIDYLTLRVQPVLWRLEGGRERRECRWVRELLALPGAWTPVPGFGNGDCREGCPAHLIAVPSGVLPASSLPPGWDCAYASSARPQADLRNT